MGTKSEVSLGVRVPAEILARLDALTRDMRAREPLVNPTRAEVVRGLIVRALEREEKERGLKSGPKARQ